MIVGWESFFKDEIKKSYYQSLIKKVDNAYLNSVVYPNKEEIFKAYSLCSLENCKVVIVGQDPYYNKNQANGLAFSVSNLVKQPPSLINIFKELKDDLMITRKDVDLSDWARQGVLLLNRVLTVEDGKPLSHNDFGWQTFTENTIKYLNEHKDKLVFVLWGNKAKGLTKYINSEKHIILIGAHPSPLSSYRGFFGSKPFSKINNYLKINGIKEISW